MVLNCYFGLIGSNSKILATGIDISHHGQTKLKAYTYYIHKKFVFTGMKRPKLRKDLGNNIFWQMM